MRQEINEQDLEKVAGGTVLIDGNNKTVGFTSTGKGFYLKNCTPNQATILVATLYESNSHLSDAAFDKLCMDALKENGWI